MGNCSLLSLTVTVFLFLVSSWPVTSKADSITSDTTTPSCYICHTDDCYDKRIECWRCESRCKEGHYRVQQIKKSQCRNGTEEHANISQNGVQTTTAAAGKRLLVREIVTGELPADASTKITTTTTTPATTTPEIEQSLCVKCQLEGCSKCRDDVVGQPQCEICFQGYVHNNNITCFLPVDESKLSGGAIAGIVIGILCVVAAVIVGLLLVVRKFHKSHNLDSRTERVKIASVTKDGYSRRSNSESKDLEELPPAPSPPEGSKHYVDMGQRCGYDQLLMKDQNDPQSYEPINLQQDYLYQNTNIAHQDSIYANTQQASSSVVSSFRQPNVNVNPTHGVKNPPFGTYKTQESAEVYEPVGPCAPADDTQEIYINDDSTKLVPAANEITEDIYMNDVDNSTDDVYENT